jgi:hypothetical protein
VAEEVVRTKAQMQEELVAVVALAKVHKQILVAQVVAQVETLYRL